MLPNEVEYEQPHENDYANNVALITNIYDFLSE